MKQTRSCLHPLHRPRYFFQVFSLQDPYLFLHLQYAFVDKARDETIHGVSCDGDELPLPSLFRSGNIELVEDVREPGVLIAGSAEASMEHLREKVSLFAMEGCFVVEEAENGREKSGEVLLDGTSHQLVLARHLQDSQREGRRRTRYLFLNGTSGGTQKSLSSPVHQSEMGDG